MAEVRSLIPAAETAAPTVTVPAVPPKIALSPVAQIPSAPVSDPVLQVVVEEAFQVPVPPVAAVSPLASQYRSAAGTVVARE